MDYKFLTRTELFDGIREDDIESVISCLQYNEIDYKKNDVIYRANTYAKYIGLVVFGSVNIVEYDYWGNKSIIGNITKGDIFALSSVVNSEKRFQSNVIANEDSTILFINIERLLKLCPKRCHHHEKLIYNLFRISVNKTLTLYKRMKHISSKTIRGKLISYLSEQAFEHGSPEFSITFNRQQLSEYLGVDRSALSNELSKMQKDGLLTYKKNTFSLKDITY